MHQTRTVVILSSILLICVIALYFGAQWLRRELVDRPYAANVKQQLRALAAAEELHRRDSLSYTNDLTRVWQPSSETHGVQLRIVRATKDGLLAEGRHSTWTGRCVMALGAQANDSLPSGEPMCKP